MTTHITSSMRTNRPLSIQKEPGTGKMWKESASRGKPSSQRMRTLVRAMRTASANTRRVSCSRESRRISK